MLQVALLMLTALMAMHPTVLPRKGVLVDRTGLGVPLSPPGGWLALPWLVPPQFLSGRGEHGDQQGESQV